MRNKIVELILLAFCCAFNPRMRIAIRENVRIYSLMLFSPPPIRSLKPSHFWDADKNTQLRVHGWSKVCGDSTSCKGHFASPHFHLGFILQLIIEQRQSLHDFYAQGWLWVPSVGPVMSGWCRRMRLAVWSKDWRWQHGGCLSAKVWKFVVFCGIDWLVKWPFVGRMVSVQVVARMARLSVEERAASFQTGRKTASGPIAWYFPDSRLRKVQTKTEMYLQCPPWEMRIATVLWMSWLIVDLKFDEQVNCRSWMEN